ncbi:phospholipase D-like domain-containing protein [Actinobaculum sp. 352]|uniref:phospholipase D-like domain-containing protein n=1 Tax=Actinobaculum sp. 352 TaxID=2490946 RepID=UPI000F7E76A5|nr:phospholipase D-like domain-containing protein [Actinobaculum sp. 352]RTE47848.1 phosphatidylserine/phosphatidylglycerophosphate/cardiolipin synthase family protein [Actinobaculum sp. 352]
MSLHHKPPREQLTRALKWGAIGLVGLQVGALASVWTVDAMRKRRTPQSGTFPHLPPQHTTVGSDEMTIYTYGRDLYDAMLRDISAAKDHIYFECFIVKADETGEEFRDALIAAARRGVETYVILDTWGNANQDPRFRHFPKMKHLHAMNFPFVRTGLLTGRSRDKGRDHRKILSVDGKVGYIGGYNIGDLYAHHWRDTHVRIAGPAAWEAEDSFIEMWNAYRKRDHPQLSSTSDHQWNSRIRSIVNTPAQNVYPISALYMEALSRASRRAWITMGYFIPDEPMLAALTNAARRGVDVRVLIPEYSNHIYADWVGRPHYDALLRSGVKLFLFEEAMVHAKTMTVDGKWSTVGTANIDRLSLRGNFEINVEVFDDGFAAAMERIFEVDLLNSHELTREMWESRGPLPRVTERILRPLAPLL